MITAAELVVKCLEAQGVKYVFGIPGAKIDAVFNALMESSIRLIVCRHEQNAAFMAGAYGRLTGEPGVVLVTSGPGVGNLISGLLTATTEGDPIVAIGGNVARCMHLKESHQSTNNVKLMEAVTKYCVEVTDAENIPEVIENSFRSALAFKRGAAFISLPQDILSQKTTLTAPKKLARPCYGPAPIALIQKTAISINQAKLPVILLGQEASLPQNTQAIRALLKNTPFPVVSTFQAAGVISRDLQENFVGRVGLFKNQPGDQLLDASDLILTIGFNPVEYDPEIWNADNDKNIFHLDYHPVDVHLHYQPKLELLGDIAETLNLLAKELLKKDHSNKIGTAKKLHEALYAAIDASPRSSQTRMHPLQVIHELRQTIDDDTLLLCDIGSVYMWMSRYFLIYEPRHFLVSNGQQTLGVALPWAIGAHFACPHKKIISISGDGGFLFSAMELETAVREKIDFIHIIWTDGYYDMVKEQELMKYQRSSGVDLGPVHIVDFARAFGAHGFHIHTPAEFLPTLQKALRLKGPVLINIPIDYSDNPALFATTNPMEGH